ncbi:MAG: class I SAM-dependent methyltransferase [Deltaproteobacteria bacterium]|nr:MAG: class I SAM-dependent methyltransferase [Deltaproteobacteria bacterium]
MITRTTCRVCDSALEPVLDLGAHYVSDFISPGDPDGTKAPLELVLCRRCRLLQLKHTVPAETMYRNYWYRSGTNQTMRGALADIANKAETLIRLKEGDAVVDIGCNDGTLLASYRTGGIRKIGFDPAENLAVFSRKIADDLVVGFFDSETFAETPGPAGCRPEIVTSIAMFYDLEDPNRFVSDIRTVMDPQGLWIVQMSYLPLMLKTNEFGNICHEHLEYYSLTSFEYLLNLHGFEVVDVELNDINGGSIRTYIRSRSADPNRFADATYRELARERVQALRDQEARLGLEDIDVYREFAVWVNRIREDVVGFIKEQVGKGKKVYVYGASTKGNTLLQYFGLDHTLITAAAERNADKWGKVTVGTRIPIVSEEVARAARPDYFLVLPWHFLEEFRLREKAYLLAGGKFIVPMPHFTLI